MGRPIAILSLSDSDAQELHRRVRATTTSRRDWLRAQIVLQRAAGQSLEAVGANLHLSVPTVSLWSQRFARDGLAGLHERPGRGRKPSLPADKVARVLEEVSRPPAPLTRWSIRSMARAVGISRHSVHRLWRQNDLKPHLTRTFKLSGDPQFTTKFWDVLALYLHPPDQALVLCCDEKSQVQALERTQAGLPVGPGQVRTRTHDYLRHGTTTLFAALDYLSGKLIGRTEARHTHVEWLRFLKQLERTTPGELTLHLIVDNYATHKHPLVRAWLERHPRMVVHFTPTGSSWLNLIERFFADLSREVIAQGSFRSLPALVRSIHAYLNQRNAAPRRYVWRAQGEEILRRIERARAAMSAVK